MRTIIRFTLKLQHRNDGNCLKDNGEMESCSVKGQTETGHLVILWDNNNNNGTTCSRETQDEASFIEDKGENALLQENNCVSLQSMPSMIIFYLMS